MKDILIGAALVFLGILVEHIFHNRQERKEKKEKTLSILKSVKAALEHNLELVRRIMGGNKDPRLFPTYGLDLVLLNNLSALKYEYIDNYQLNKNIDWAHFQIQHISRIIDAIYDCAIKNELASVSELNKALSLLCGENVKFIGEVLENIEVEINKLG